MTIVLPRLSGYVRAMSTRLFKWLMMAVFVMSQSTLMLGHISAAQASSISDVDYAAYTMPDGSVPIICLTDDEEGNASHVHCEGCLSHGVDSALFSIGFSVVNSKHSFVEFAINQTAYRKLFSAQRTRGPPLVA